MAASKEIGSDILHDIQVVHGMSFLKALPATSSALFYGAMHQ
jgi:hypothetical protein